MLNCGTGDVCFYAMRSFPSTAILSSSVALMLAMAPVGRAADDTFRAPDSLLLKDGRVVRGLIIKNTSQEILLQEKTKETSYPKSEIVRINDAANVNIEFTEIPEKGELPAWRVIANDLRTNDAIRSLEEIPSTRIDNGVFKNVPYMSFRVNGTIELNIYGNPEDPAGIEFGIYGGQSGDSKLRKTLRSYLAGYLTTRGEVATLYSLSMEGGVKDSGRLTFEVTPKEAPDAYGAWWISLYNKKDLNAARLSDKAYAKVTVPVDQVVDKRGRVIPTTLESAQNKVTDTVDALKVSARNAMYGFYRDKDGRFRLGRPPEED
jgi:hypothetical protein